MDNILKAINRIIAAIRAGSPVTIGDVILDTSNPMPVTNGTTPLDVDVVSMPVVTVNTTDIETAIEINGVKLDAVAAENAVQNTTLTTIETLLKDTSMFSAYEAFKLDDKLDPAYFALAKTNGEAVVIRVDDSLGTIDYFITTEAYVLANWANRANWIFVTPSNLT